MNRILIKIVEYGLYIFVFLFLWQTRWIWQEGLIKGEYWEYGSFSLYGLDILLVVLFTLSLFTKKEKGASVKNVWILIISFAAIALLSIFFSLDHELSWYSFGRLVMGVLIFWVILRVRFDFIKIGISLVAAGFIQSLFGLYQFFAQNTPVTKWLGLAAHLPEIPGTFVVGTATGRFLRAYGSLPHPNMLAGFLVVCLLVIVGLYLSLYANKRQKKFLLKAILLTVSFCVILSGLLVTFSRSAWCALGMALIVLLLVYLFKKKQEQAWLVAKVLITSILLVAVTVILVPDLFQTRIGGQERLEVKSYQERQAYFKESADLLKKYWHRGVGIGNYTKAIYSKVQPNKEVWEYQPVHNIYVLIAGEISVFGFIVFLLLIFEVLKSAVFTMAAPASLVGLADKGREVWLYVFSTIFLVVCIIGLFDHYLWTLPFGIFLFWLVLGFWAKLYGRLSFLP